MGQFEAWLQKRLVDHGANILVDGDWGRNSISALEAFQKRKRLRVTGVADAPTIEALRKPETPADPPPPGAAHPPEEVMPPWMAELHRRMGLHEVRDNAALTDFLKIGKWLGNPKDLPWCGDAVESALSKTLPREALPSNPFWAQGWNTWGVDVKQPIVGSIGVIRWTARTGHVGFVAGVSGSRVNMLGGNQSNSISVASFPRSKFIGFRWPQTFPLKSYPALQGTALPVNESSTR